MISPSKYATQPATRVWRPRSSPTIRWVATGNQWSRRISLVHSTGFPWQLIESQNWVQRWIGALRDDDKLTQSLRKWPSAFSRYPNRHPTEALCQPVSLAYQHCLYLFTNHYHNNNNNNNGWLMYSAKISVKKTQCASTNIDANTHTDLNII